MSASGWSRWRDEPEPHCKTRCCAFGRRPAAGVFSTGRAAPAGPKGGAGDQARAVGGNVRRHARQGALERRWAVALGLLLQWTGPFLAGAGRGSREIGWLPRCCARAAGGALAVTRRKGGD